MKIETIAKKILAFDPGDDATFVAVGINEPMKPSATGLTWQDIRALASAALPPGTKVSKSAKKAAQVKLTPA